MLTNIFPIPGIKMLNSTSVCYYFAKEWVKLGYEVVVYYNYTIYTPFLHVLAKFFGKKISNIFPTVINEKRYKRSFEYNIDGIKVILVPVYKFMPKIAFPNDSILDSAKYIVDNNCRMSFKPDIVVGHFLHPNLEIISYLKSRYKIPMALVLHGELTSKQDILAVKRNLSNVDIWGYRSFRIKKVFETHIAPQKKQFMCFSGVPSKYIDLQSFKKFYNNELKYIYVGNLIHRKHPLTVLQALHQVYQGADFRLSYVGDGDEKRKILSYIKNKSLGNNVLLKGRVERDRVREEVNRSECFIMVSEAETFGLVYLEAMANGCIVVASRNEGMDGIIKDGENGFLCSAGNVSELASVVQRIQNMSILERVKMSKMAIQTALKMTDELVAASYIKDVERYCHDF